MLTPEQLLHLPDNLVRLYAQLEEDILADMAARISARELFIPAADWQFQKLAEMGNTYDMILAKLSAATEKTEQELREMMTIAASESLKYDDAVHKAAGKELPPLNQSAALLATLNAGMEKTKGYFQNLCRTTANHGSKQFADALDRAYMQVTSGAFTKEQAIKTAVKDLTSQGIAAAEYKNGRKMSLESAVRMNVVTGVNQTCAELQLQRCDEAGCDLVEVSAHAGARPSHAVWQGKLYSRSGTHPKYPDFALSTGYGTVTGLCGANCRHNFYPFYEGISKRAYTHRELGQMNARTIRYNGQRLTEYEASQVQRKIERNLRRWKREQAAMKAAGQSTEEAAAKLKYWRGEMDSFIRQTGFKRQYSREEIFGKNSAVKLPGAPSGGKMKLSTDERWALNEYISSGAYKVNEPLRNKTSLTEEQRKLIRNLDAALEKLPIYEGTVYRSLSSFGIADIDAFVKRHQVGAVEEYPSYTSASIEVYDDTFPIQYVMESKTGRSLQEYNPDEAEVLFLRDTSFKITRIDGYTIYMEEV